MGGVWFEGAGYPTTNQALFSLVREPKRPYLCTEVSSNLSSNRETLLAELSPLASHKNQTKRNGVEIRRYLLAVSTGHHMPHTPAIVQQKMA